MAVSFVGEAHNDSGSATTLTITSTVNAGDNVLVLFTAAGSTLTITSVLDNNSNAYSLLGSAGDNVNFAKVWVYGRINAPAATSIVITFSAAALSNGSVLRYSGATAFGNTGSNTSLGSTNPTLSATTQDNNNYVASIFADLGGGGTHTAQNGTIRLNAFNFNQASRFITIVDNTSASPASVTDSFTTVSSVNYAGFGVEVRSGGGGQVFFSLPDDGEQFRAPDSTPRMLAMDDWLPLVPQSPVFEWDEPQRWQLNCDSRSQQEDEPWHTFFLIPPPPPNLGWDDWDWSRDYSTVYANWQDAEPFDFSLPMIPSFGWFEETQQWYGMNGLSALVVLDEFVRAPIGAGPGPSQARRSVRFGWMTANYR